MEKLKQAVIRMNNKVKCPHCLFWRRNRDKLESGLVVTCEFCNKQYEVVQEKKMVRPLKPVESEMLTAPILGDGWADCPYHRCGHCNDVLGRRSDDVVKCAGCDKRFKLVAASSVPKVESIPPPV